MLLRFLLFYVVVLLVLTGLGRYVHRRASETFGLGGRAKKALAAVFVAACVTLLATRLFGRWLSGGFIRVPAAIGATTALALVIAAVLLGLVDLVRLVVRLLPKSAAAPAPASASAPASAPASVHAEHEQPHPWVGPNGAVGAPPLVRGGPCPRRAFLARAASGSALFVAGTSSIYGALIGRSDYQIEELVAPIPGLGRALDGYTLAQLSDIHIGLYVGEAELEAAFDRITRIRPDLIVLTGDLIDYDVRYAELLGRFVRRLGGAARDGVVAIPGNHDYYAGIDPIFAALRSAGARVLCNEGLVVGGEREGFSLLGVDDVYASMSGKGKGPDLEQALRSVPADLPRVLLAHNPVTFEDAIDKVALQLSGHTHGGQINLGIRPADYLLRHGYVAGAYRERGSLLYVNRGFGTVGPPARIGAPPEVTRVVLSSA